MLEKYPAESTLFAIDCSALLEASELITGTPEMTSLPALEEGAALEFGAPAVNTTPISFPDGRSVAAGKVIIVRISAGESQTDTVRREYAVLATFETSDGNTLVARAPLRVLPPGP